MKKQIPISISKTPGWPWFVFASLLAIRFTCPVTEKLFLSLEPDWFLPLFAGWSGYRYGPQILRSLLRLGVLAVVGIAVSLPIANGIGISAGFGPDSYLLALATAVAFAQPKWSFSSEEWFCPWWRGAVWIALLGLAIGGFLGGSLQFPLAKRFEIQANPGVPLAILAIAGCLRWRFLVMKARSAWADVANPLSRIFAAALMAIALVTLLLNLNFSVGGERPFTYSLNAGLSYPSPLLLALCFILPASGIRNRRFWFGILATLAGGILISWLISPAWTRLKVGLDQAINAPAKHASRPPADWGLLVDCASAVLLGFVLSPFWRRQEVPSLRSRWTSVVLGIVLVAEFLVIPVVRKSGDFLDGLTPWVLGGVAYIAGLVWREKGLFVAPLFIEMYYLASLVGFPDPTNRVSIGGNMRLALIMFPFAFFGLLSNRYDRAPGNSVATAPKLIPERSETSAASVDITPLARVVRRLDVSATLKTFAAVLVPLVVVHNLVVLSAGAQIAAAFRDEFSFSQDFAMAGAIAAIAIVVVLAPFGFLVVDWLARKDSWRYLSAISGALLGGIGFAVLGALLALIIQEVHDQKLRSWILGAAFLLQLGLGTWLLARSRGIRTALLGIASLAAVLTAGAVGFALWKIMFRPRSESDEDTRSLAIGLVFLVLVVWWLVRAVRLRIVLSGDRPRSLLLGDLHRRGFFVRVAFLMGLPSSLWNWAALHTLAFWCFIVSRGLVFVGFQLLLTDVYAAYGSAIRVLATGKARAASGVLLILAGHAVFYLGKRLAARYAWIPKSTADPSAPVLFLRSFEDDQFTFKRPPWDLMGRWFDLWSFRRNADETLIDEVAQYGPVVALGRPGEKRVPFGARRYYSSHEDWQAIITETARRARAVVICAGATPGVVWEYDLLARERLLDRTVLLFRPTREGNPSNREALEAFQRATSSPVLPDVPASGNWVALLPIGKSPALLRADKPTAAAYVLALRAHFQQRTAAELADRALA